MQMCVYKSSLHCQLAVLLSLRLDEAEVVGKLWHEVRLSWMICSPVVPLLGHKNLRLKCNFGHMTPVELRRPRPVEMR